MAASKPEGGSSQAAAPEAAAPASRTDTDPTTLDIARLRPGPVFPAGGEALYRQVARLTELSAEQTVLEVPCGAGHGTELLASITGAECFGIDPSEERIAEAEQRTRSHPKGDLLHFDSGSPQDLPFRDGIFDVVLGGIGLAILPDPALAIREMARVTRPMGTVVLVQPIWTGNVDESRREALVKHLGARPMLLVEWKHLLREAGVVDLHVEDWSDYASPFRPSMGRSLQDVSDLYSLRQKAVILHRAYRRWGWRGVRGAVVREREMHRLLSQRVLGLSLIRGTRWTGAVAEKPAAAREG